VSCGGLFLGIRKSTLIGWSSELGGSPLASSMAVIPNDQISAWNISRSLTEMQKNLLVNWKVQTSQVVCKFWSFIAMMIHIYLTDTCKKYYNNNGQLSVNLKYSATVRKVCDESACWTFCTVECTHGYETADCALT